jgi:hypothetical protein
LRTFSSSALPADEPDFFFALLTLLLMLNSWEALPTAEVSVFRLAALETTGVFARPGG